MGSVSGLINCRGGLAVWLVLPGLFLGGAAAISQETLSPEAAAAWQAVAGGKPLRVVWLRDPDLTSTDRLATGAGLQLLATDGTGVRVLREGGRNVSKPMFTPDGSAVVFTEKPADPAGDPGIRLIGFEGTGEKDLGPGTAVAVHRDAETGTTQVYALDSLTNSSRTVPSGETLMRFDPAHPDEREIVWSATPLSVDGVQISRDGRRMAAGFPWPKAGLADLTDQTWEPLAHGAWTGLAPDDSYAAWVLDGSRRRLRLFAPNLDPGWELAPGELPEVQGSIYHPRWSNDPHVITFTGPWADDGSGPASVFVARLRDDFRRVEAVARLSTGQRDLYPDVWVGTDGAPVVSALPQQPEVLARAENAVWPASTDGLAFSWQAAGAGPDLIPHGWAGIGRNGAMDLSAGWMEAPAAAAQTLADGAAASGGWAMECILTERRTDSPVSVRLVTLRRPDGRDAFALYRVDRKLVLRMLAGGADDAVDYPLILTSMVIQDDRPFHLALTLDGDRLGCYIDGQMAKDVPVEKRGLGAWQGGQLFFGDPAPYGTPWTGALERVALWSRTADREDVQQWAGAAGKFLEGRKRPQRIRVKATREAAPESPPAEGPDQLAVSLWRVENLITGTLTVPRFQLLQRVRVNGNAVPDPLPPPGTSAELWIEPLDEHAELAALPLPPSADFPLYLNALPPGRALP